MLLDYYYSIQNRQTVAGITLFDVVLLPECSVYEGHFPGMPVAPGVCNIQMIKECVEQIIGQSVLFEAIDQCKFITMIRPEQHRELQVRVELTEMKEDGWKVTASIGQDETDYIVLKGNFLKTKRQ